MERNRKVEKQHPFTFPAAAEPLRTLPGRRPDLNSSAPRLSGSSLRLLRQFGGGISEGGADRLANMFSGGICIMSAVHRQRSCSAPVPPLVIYLAALLKCSCRWHWLTNQTVKTRPEYQNTALQFLGGKKIFVCLPLLDCVLFKSSLTRFTFFFFLTPPPAAGVLIQDCSWDLAEAVSLKERRLPLLTSVGGSGEQTSAVNLTLHEVADGGAQPRAPQPPREKSSSETSSICVFGPLHCATSPLATVSVLGVSSRGSSAKPSETFASLTSSCCLSLSFLFFPPPSQFMFTLAASESCLASVHYCSCSPCFNKCL